MAERTINSHTNLSSKNGAMVQWIKSSWSFFLLFCIKNVNERIRKISKSVPIRTKRHFFDTPAIKTQCKQIKMSSEPSSDIKVSFIPKKRKNLRQRNVSDDEDDANDTTQETMWVRKFISPENKKKTHIFYVSRSKLVETKERQKLRNKPNGVNIIGLALGKKITVEQELTNVRLWMDAGHWVNLINRFYSTFNRGIHSIQNPVEWLTCTRWKKV